MVRAPPLALEELLWFLTLSPSSFPAVGIICTKTNVHQIAREAIENATYVCEEHFGLFKAPPVQLICPKDLNFMYVPSHLVRSSLLVFRSPSPSVALLAHVSKSELEPHAV